MISIKNLFLAPLGWDIIRSYAIFLSRYLACCIPLIALHHLIPDRWRKISLVISGIALIAFFYSPMISAFMTLAVILLYASMFRRVEQERKGIPWLPLAVVATLFGIIYGGFFLRYRGYYVRQEHIGVAFLLAYFFRRVTYYFWEAASGRVRELRLDDTFIYFLAWPFLTGRTVVLSYSHLTQSYRRAPASEDLISGGQTLLWAFGHLYLFTLLPFDYLRTAEIELYQGRFAGAWTWVPGALVMTYVCSYLFRFGNEQMGIGFARLLGYDVRDNYQQPLAAPSFAERWRRWNIHWREAMMGMFFQPVFMSLTRRNENRENRNMLAAVAVTFAGSSAFNLLLVAILVRPGVWSVLWKMTLYMAAYDGIQAVLVGLSILRQNASPVSGRSPIGGWAAAVDVAWVFLVQSALQPLFYTAVTPGVFQFLNEP